MGIVTLRTIIQNAYLVSESLNNFIKASQNEEKASYFFSISFAMLIDGGDCCPVDGRLGDGFCNSGAYNSKHCNWVSKAYEVQYVLNV